jgi:hypothetical protein
MFCRGIGFAAAHENARRPRDGSARRVLCGTSDDPQENRMTNSTVLTPEPRVAPRRMEPFPWVRPLVLRCIVGSVIAAGMVGAVSAVLGEFGGLSWRLMGTIALFLFFALSCWYDADVSARRAPWFGIASMVVSILLLLVGMWKVWIAQPAPDLFYVGPHLDRFTSWAWLVFVARIALLHIHLLLTNRDRLRAPVMQLVTNVTLGLVVLLAVLLALPALNYDLLISEPLWRAIAAIAILDALGTVLIPLVYRLFHSNGAPGLRQAPAGRRSSPAGYVAWPSPTVQQQHVPEQSGHAAHGAQPAQPAEPEPARSPYLRSPYTQQYEPKMLEWPRYTNGQPLPAKADGTPDFTGVIGY